MVESNQIGSLVIAEELSDLIVRKHKDLAESYEPGVTLNDIARKNPEIFRCHTPDIANTALRIAFQILLGKRARDIARKNSQMFSSTGGKNSVNSRGLTAYLKAEESPNGIAELDYVNMLKEDSRYQYQEGYLKGKTNWKLIDEQTREIYRPQGKLRGSRVLRTALYRHLKSKK